MRKNVFCFLTKKGQTFPLVKISFFERYSFFGFTVFYAAMSHLAALYCLIWKKPVFKRTKTTMERNNIFATIRRYVKS